MRWFLSSLLFSVFQYGVYYTGVKIFNNLPLELKQLIKSPMKFKVAIRKNLDSHCFYTVDEFFNLNWNCNFVNMKCFKLLHINYKLYIHHHVWLVPAILRRNITKYLKCHILIVVMHSISSGCIVPVLLDLIEC